VLGYDCPNQIEVYGEILMNYNIAESDDLAPGNLGVSFAKLRRQPCAGFAKQSQPVQNGALSEDVAKEDLPAPSGKPADQVDLIYGV
jgi:hypothetical protein